MTYERSALREPGGPLQTGWKVLALVGFSVRRRTTLFGGVAVRAGFIGVTMFAFAQIWRAVQGLGQSHPAGFSLTQLLWYLAIAEANVASTPGGWALEVDREVRGGDVAYRLARPIDYPLYHLGTSLGDRLVRFVACLIVGCATAWLCVGPLAATPRAIAAGLLCSGLGLLVDELIVLSISLSAFWIENTSGLHLLYRRGLLVLGGALIPLAAYPDWLAKICSALPFRHLAAGPARLFVSTDAAGFSALLRAQLELGAIAASAIALLFTLGRRRIAAQGG